LAFRSRATVAFPGVFSPPPAATLPLARQSRQEKRRIGSWSSCASHHLRAPFMSHTHLPRRVSPPPTKRAADADADALALFSPGPPAHQKNANKKLKTKHKTQNRTSSPPAASAATSGPPQASATSTSPRASAPPRPGTATLASSPPSKGRAKKSRTPSRTFSAATPRWSTLSAR
jgi:hypothetical protein